jgi:hypothetical protein
MFSPITRRRFVNGAVQGGLLASLADFSFLDALPSAGAAGPPVRPKVPPLASVASDVEPLVRLIEDTPRAALLEKVIDQIRKGTSYQQLLSAVFLAGARGIQPRPVGFKFHAVLVINSAHLASLASSDKDRWLPLLWSIDNFKASQAANKVQGDWHMAAVQESKLPSSTGAKQRFLAAMDNWNVEDADRAIVSLCRSEGMTEVYELLWRYGARDFRDIGHKAIYAANSLRTLQAIGWRHAEPILRSLAYAMLDDAKDGNPAKRDLWRDRPGRVNLVRAEKLKRFQHAGKSDGGATKDVLAALRTANADEMSSKILGMIAKGIHPASIWDGLFLGAGELLMRAPGIVGLHTLTSTNALHQAYQTSGVGPTRAYLLLQTGAFLTMFRDEIKRRGGASSLRVDAVEPVEAKDGIEEIFADITKEKPRAASKTLALLRASPRQLQPMMAAARRLIFAKGRDSHDYKFSSAVLEDVYNLPANLRPQYMAASVFWLKGSGDADNGLISRARAALAKA